MAPDAIGDGALASLPPTATASRVGFVILTSYLLLMGALGLAVTAGWHAYHDHVESTQWPAVQARASDCRVHTSYDSIKGRARALHHIECLFAYEVDDAPYVAKTAVGNAVSVVRGQIALTRPKVTLVSLQGWVKRHPNGAVETVHYDPADPHRISVVGVDDDVRWQTTGGYVQGALVFGLAGVGLLLVGVALRRRTQTGTSTVPHAPTS
jgi:uncharacterized protein DUF3592